jgi:hypothetical protein
MAALSNRFCAEFATIAPPSSVRKPTCIARTTWLGTPPAKFGDEFDGAEHREEAHEMRDA